MRGAKTYNIESSTLSFDFQLFTKCILLETIGSLQRLIYDTKNSELITSFDDLREERKMFTKLSTESNSRELKYSTFSLTY